MQNVKYAYKQAPWRKQLRWAALILVGLVIAVMVAIAYLNVSAKTYAVGVEIQALQGEEKSLQNRIADLHNQLGSATAFDIMSEKANEKGYKIISDPSRIVFLSVPGYIEPPLNIEVPQGRKTAPEAVIKSLYTRSLWDLLMSGALKLEDNK
ncbi:MAG: hypothetical protein AAGU05_10335 [Anaerolineaceae bacterium]